MYEIQYFSKVDQAWCGTEYDPDTRRDVILVCAETIHIITGWPVQVLLDGEVIAAWGEVVKLTSHQRTILQAALECDSITSRRFRLQDLIRLEKRGFLEAFDSEEDLTGTRIIVKFFITDTGRALLGEVAS